MRRRGNWFWGNCHVRKFISMMVFGAAIAATPAHAGNAVASADAAIVRPLSFITDQNLDFGSMLPSTGAGTVVVPPTGARTQTGGVTLLGGTAVPARFAGLGASGQQVQVSMGANSYAVPRVGGGAPAMTMDTFIIGSTPTAVLTTNPRVFFIGSATGIFNFPIGATLHMAANQPAGVYQTTFSVTLIYQ
jgi:Domain of unknown function (DUF4402)